MIERTKRTNEKTNDRTNDQSNEQIIWPTDDDDDTEQH